MLDKGKTKLFPTLLLLLKTSIICLFFSTIYLAVRPFHLADYFPIHTVRVYGLQHVKQQEVQEILLPLVRHGFFTTNVEYIRDRLLQIPWISDIFVRRTWPDRIDITIFEKNPIARWNTTSLLSETGELFTPKPIGSVASLPQFVGPAGKQILMLQTFKDFTRLLAPLHTQVAYLELTPFSSWILKLTNGISLQLGHEDVLTRLDHFVKVYPKIVGERAKAIDTIDLRYANGVAVRWKMVQPSIKT